MSMGRLSSMSDCTRSRTAVVVSALIVSLIGKRTPACASNFQKCIGLSLMFPAVDASGTLGDLAAVAVLTATAARTAGTTP